MLRFEAWTAAWRADRDALVDALAAKDAEISKWRRRVAASHSVDQEDGDGLPRRNLRRPSARRDSGGLDPADHPTLASTGQHQDDALAHARQQHPHRRRGHDVGRPPRAATVGGDNGHGDVTTTTTTNGKRSDRVVPVDETARAVLSLCHAEAAERWEVMAAELASRGTILDRYVQDVKWLAAAAIDRFAWRRAAELHSAAMDAATHRRVTVVPNAGAPPAASFSSEPPQGVEVAAIPPGGAKTSACDRRGMSSDELPASQGYVRQYGAASLLPPARWAQTTTTTATDIMPPARGGHHPFGGPLSAPVSMSTPTSLPSTAQPPSAPDAAGRPAALPLPPSAPAPPLAATAISADDGDDRLLLNVIDALLHDGNGSGRGDQQNGGGRGDEGPPPLQPLLTSPRRATPPHSRAHLSDAASSPIHGPFAGKASDKISVSTETLALPRHPPRFPAEKLQELVDELYADVRSILLEADDGATPADVS